MSDKVIVTCALTGAQQGKEANPNLPEQPEEIVEQALDAARAGAAIVHIHARDRRGKATADVGVFREIVEGIRAKSDVVLNLSTGGAVAGLPLEARLRVLPELKPEIASFSCGSGSLLGRYDPASRKWLRDRFVPLVLSYTEMEAAARLFKDSGVRPELEIYGTSFLNNVWHLREAGVLEEPLLINLVMNIPGECIPWSPKNVLFFVESLPPNNRWVVTAGRFTSSPSRCRWPWAGMSGSAWKTTSTSSAACSPAPMPRSSRRPWAFSTPSARRSPRPPSRGKSSASGRGPEAGEAPASWTSTSASLRRL